MPLPVIHSFAGYQIYKLSLGQEEDKSWKMAALFMVMANLADLDMIPGMLIGNPQIFHRSVTHSLGAAVIVSLLAAFSAKWFKKLPALKMFLISLAAYFSHVLLDYVTGVVQFMFWPFKILIKPMTITAHFQHHLTLADCAGLGQFCQILICPSVTLRLFSEAVLVYGIIKISKAFSKSPAHQPGISDSPSLVAGLAIFLFVLSALLATQAAG